MQRFTIGLPLAPLAVGDQVDRAAWPPHVTLVGNSVAADGSVDVLAAVLRRTAAQVTPFTAVVGPEARFGPGGDVPVDLVAADGLRALHDRLLDAIEEHVEGFALDEPVHSRAGYRPHRTVTAGARPSPGSSLALGEVVLSELEPQGRPGRAVVVARSDLGPARLDATVDAATVHRVLDGLASAGARSWVIGGWGVDALAGRASRQHHDLDLFVDGHHVLQAVEALAALGFTVRSTWSENRWSDRGGRLVPSAFVAVDADGREVDVHAVTLDADRRPVPLSVSAVVLPPGALDGTGSIGGRSVQCATAAAQLVMHTGYPLPDRQRGDVAALRGLPRP